VVAGKFFQSSLKPAKEGGAGCYVRRHEILKLMGKPQDFPHPYRACARHGVFRLYVGLYASTSPSQNYASRYGIHFKGVRSVAKLNLLRASFTRRSFFRLVLALIALLAVINVALESIAGVTDVFH
jgi:hypothetical protein